MGFYVKEKMKKNEALRTFCVLKVKIISLSSNKLQFSRVFSCND